MPQPPEYCLIKKPHPTVDPCCMQRMPCPQSVSLQIQESFNSFRKELSCDLQDWKRVVCSELRFLIQSKQLIDKEARVANASSTSTASLSVAPVANERAEESTIVAANGSRNAEEDMYSSVEVGDSMGHSNALVKPPASLASPSPRKDHNGNRKSVAVPAFRRFTHDSWRHSHYSSSGHDMSSNYMNRISRFSAAGNARGVKLFGHADMIFKDRLTSENDAYNVEKLYHTSGIAQCVAKSNWFNLLTLLMICSSAVYMGIDADSNKSDRLVDAKWQFQVAELVFSIFFTLEILIRFGAFARKCDALRDIWFCTDTLLVVHMLIDNYVFSFLPSSEKDSKSRTIVRLVRLLRLARFTRLIRTSSGIMTMLKAMYVATQAVASAVMMLCFLTYCFALALHSLLIDDAESMAAYFGDVPKSMWTLLLQGIFMDAIGDLFFALREIPAPISICVLLLFVLLSTFVVMNMLLGIFCEVVSKVAEAEEESDARFRLSEVIMALLRKIDRDSSGSMSKDEFLEIFNDSEALGTFRDLEIDVGYVYDMQDMLFTDEEREVPISAVMDLLLRHRGDRPCHMGDMVAAMQFMGFRTEREMQKCTIEVNKSLKKEVKEVVSRTTLQDSIPQSLKYHPLHTVEFADLNTGSSAASPLSPLTWS